MKALGENKKLGQREISATQKVAFFIRDTPDSSQAPAVPKYKEDADRDLRDYQPRHPDDI